MSELETKHVPEGEPKKRSGVCKIKAEFIIEDRYRTGKKTDQEPSEPPLKKLKTNNEEVKSEQEKTEEPGIKEENYEEEKSVDVDKKEHCPKKVEKRERSRGQNKARPVPYKLQNQQRFCPHLLDQTIEETSRICIAKSCIFMHDRMKYLESKPEDIEGSCHFFESIGKCQRGISCRQGSKHISPEGYNIINQEKYEAYKKDPKVTTKNQISKDVQEKLERFKYDFRKAEMVLLKHTPEKFKDNVKPPVRERVMINIAELNEMSRNKPAEEETKALEENASLKVDEKPNGAILDTEEIKLRKCEKKKIVWKDKVMLSPLTTVGNLPFRRICKEFGADVTCGEMALAIRLLKGAQGEWALTKRHESEDLFGVQICGNKPAILTRCAQLLEQETEIDFVDINLGCPIDLIYKQGAGCGMLGRTSILETTVKSVSDVLTIPLTVKTRTGIYMDRPIAHNLMPKFRDWGADMIQLHGRSREQRYTKHADWTYIEKCAQAAAPVPLFGAGDILSYDDYQRVRKEFPSVSGVSIGRGALIKPWIFQEIKEQKLIDISSSERFDVLKKYCKYGLEHWGSDTRGVETTRRFLLEWISFLHRYIPVGILENPPQKMNERPPYYKGRDELETLMVSSNCEDWIKISEMLLGKVPDGFHFLPKHKANSWK